MKVRSLATITPDSTVNILRNQIETVQRNTLIFRNTVFHGIKNFCHSIVKTAPTEFSKDV